MATKRKKTSGDPKKKKKSTAKKKKTYKAGDAGMASINSKYKGVVKEANRLGMKGDRRIGYIYGTDKQRDSIKKVMKKKYR